MFKFSVSVVTHSCLTLCDPMDCSTPGLPVHHQLPEFAQTHTCRISDAIQPSHPLLSPFPPTFNLSQHQGLSNESVLHIRWPKYWSFSFSISPSNEHPGLVSFRMDWLDLNLPPPKRALQGLEGEGTSSSHSRRGRRPSSQSSLYEVLFSSKAKPALFSKWLRSRF